MHPSYSNLSNRHAIAGHIRHALIFLLLSCGLGLTLFASANFPNTGNAKRLAPEASAQSVAVPSPSDGSFTSSRPMFLARSYHTATLLGNGKVLIAGGTITGSTFTNTAELFDPASGTFTLLSPTAMTAARSGHTATLLPSGKVLLAGGYTGSEIKDTVEWFDPVSGTFTLVASAMTLARYGQTATLLPNGKIFLAGGMTPSGATNTAELFDPATETFTQLPNIMSSARVGHTATLLSNGKVLITGGSSGTPQVATNTADLFDPESATFVAVSPMTLARYGHTATLLGSGKVLIAGGDTNDGPTNTAELFDSVSGMFSLLPAMTATRSFHTATLLTNSQVLIAGGILEAGYTGNIVTNTAELFDPSSQTFAPMANTMTSVRDAHTATLFPSGKVLLTGGEVGSGTVDSIGVTNLADLFDPNSGPGFPPAPGLAGAWSLVASPNPANGFPILERTTCPSAMDCWAVGFYQDIISGNNQTFIEHWDGTSWNIVPSADSGALSQSALYGVTCTSASNCWAAGLIYNANVFPLQGQTLIEHWDGNSWSIVDSPNSSADTFNALWDVTCTSVSDCWAVGQQDHYNPNIPKLYRFRTLMEHWDGTRWTIVDSPNRSQQDGPFGDDYVVKVTCHSADDCWAVGTYQEPTAGLQQTLIERWDGTSWTLADSPNFTNFERQHNLLYGVTCSSANDCWATGLHAEPNNFTLPSNNLPNPFPAEGLVETLIEHWDGNAWAIAPSPESPVPMNGGILEDVACASRSNCWAVGWTQDSITGSTIGQGTTLTLIEHWDGASWSIVNSPNGQPEHANTLDGVGCASDSLCWATGYYLGGGSQKTLIEVFSPAIPPLTSVGSRMTHGSAGPFDVDLPLSGSRGIECRSGGSNNAYQLIFTFMNNLTAVGLASVDTGTGTVSSSAIGPNPNQYTVNLSGVTNQQYITVTLNRVLDSQNNTGNVSATMGVLLGDVNASGRVDAADVSLVRQQTLQSITSSNFREDVNASGRIDAADVSVVRQQTLTSLP